MSDVTFMMFFTFPDGEDGVLTSTSFGVEV
jgi:hypothetical protein